MNLYKKGKESVVTKKQSNPSWSGPVQLSRGTVSSKSTWVLNIMTSHGYPWSSAVRVHPSGLDLDLLRSAKDLEWSSITGTLSTTNNGCHKSRWPSYSNSTELRFRKEPVLNIPTRNRHPVVFDTAVTYLLHAQVSSSFVRCVWWRPWVVAACWFFSAPGLWSANQALA